MDCLRNKILMDKEWKFSRDHQKSTWKDYTNSYQATRAGNRYREALPDFDTSSWRNVDLPHDWAVESEFDENQLVSHGYKARGTAWYRKVFRLDSSYEGKRLLLCFGGVSNQCTVYFNGSLIGRNFSGYNEFTIDISDRAYCSERENVLAVEVDAENIEGWFYEGAGIYRHVWLYVKDNLHISHDGIWVKPQMQEGDSWNIMVETMLENAWMESVAFSVVQEIYDRDLRLVAAHSLETDCGATEKKTVSQTMKLEHPDLWSVDSPHLYIVKTRIMQDGQLIDLEQTTFGCRVMGIISGKGLFLNGRSIKIKGACNHQDHAGIGVALPDSIHDYRVRKLKEAGCNAYRCAHHMPARELLEACDRHGMLVMDENRHFESSAETLSHVEIMVRRDRNHPCVVFYSLFNEEPLAATPAGRTVFRHLRETVERLDDTRIITGGMNEDTMMSEIGAAQEMDITGFNYSLMNFEKFHGLFPGQPVIGSENCANYSTRGCYESNRKKHVLNCYDMEHESFFNTMRETWSVVSAHDYITGIFIWAGFDYRGEPGPFTWPSVSTQFGLMDTCGIRKDAFYFAKACFDDEPMLHLLPHWNWKSGAEVKVMTVTNCDEAELFVNDRSLGRKPSDVCTQCEWNVTYEPGILKAIAYKNGVPVVTAETRTAGKPKRIHIVPDRTSIYNNGSDTVPVNICLVDADGILVPDCTNHMTFKLEGDGVILGVGNGNPNSHESDKLPERDLFAGWCQVLVQAASDADTLMLLVSSKGMETAALKFEIQKK